MRVRENHPALADLAPTTRDLRFWDRGVRGGDPIRWDPAAPAYLSTAIARAYLAALLRAAGASIEGGES